MCIRDRGSVLEKARLWLSDRYTGILARGGRYVSSVYGVFASQGDEGLYVSKWGLDSEIAKSVVKKAKSGYSPWGLLEAFGTGKAWAGDLFVEYVHAMKGKNQLVWSRGLRDLLGLDEEKTDEEIVVEKDQAAILLASLSWRQWKVILGIDARGEVLEVASNGDPELLRKFLVSIGAY